MKNQESVSLVSEKDSRLNVSSRIQFALSVLKGMMMKGMQGMLALVYSKMRSCLSCHDMNR